LERGASLREILVPNDAARSAWNCAPLRAWNFTPGGYIAVMKSIVFPALVALLIATGCKPSDKSQPVSSTDTNSSAGVLQAPADYVGALGRAKQNAGKTVDVASLNQAIGLFQVDKSRFPKDLDELVQEKYLKKLPEVPYGMKLDYDSTTGQVKVVNQ
jgi:hypothetical protein